MPPTPAAKRRKTSHTSTPASAAPTPQPTTADVATARRSSTRLRTPSAKVAATSTASPAPSSTRSTRRGAASKPTSATRSARRNTQQQPTAAEIDQDDDDNDDEIEVLPTPPAAKRGSARRASTRPKGRTGPLKEGDGNTPTPVRRATGGLESGDDDVDELGEGDDVYALPVSPLASVKPKGKMQTRSRLGTETTLTNDARMEDEDGAREGSSRRKKAVYKPRQTPVEDRLEAADPLDDSAGIQAPLDDSLDDQDGDEPGYMTASEGDDAAIVTTDADTDTIPPDPRFDRLKHIALGRTAQKRPIPLINLTEEHAKVHTLLSQTVAAGEGNSMLVIGARGTGKTSLVNSILRDLASEHKDSFHVIRLNGFMQTDDKLALREIWRQLGREMDVDDDDKPGARGSNYADTLAKLLQLLSHPDEMLPQSFSTADIAHGQQPASVLQDKPAVAAKSVVFIMDEFDLFATHPRQTLLYNLFDIAQSRKAPIAILGLTTRIDVAESLEKRVKSRFSHRYVHLPLPRSFKHLEDVCSAALTITAADLADQKDEEDRATLEALVPAWNAAVLKSLLRSPAQQRVLHHIFATTRSVPEALTSLILPLSTFSATSQSIGLRPGMETALLPPQSSLHILASLSTLQLALIIAAARLEIILSSSGTALALAPTSGACNFNAVYAEYVDLVARARLTASVSSSSGLAAGGAAALGGAAIGGRVWGRDVARAAWEGLRRAGLLVAANASGGGTSGFGGIGGGPGVGAAPRVDELVRCDIALEEIEGAVDAGCRVRQGADRMPAGLRKWCREI